MLPRHCKQNLLGGGAGLLLAAATGALLALALSLALAAALLGGAASLATLTTEQETNRIVQSNKYQKTI